MLSTTTTSTPGWFLAALLIPLSSPTTSKGPCGCFVFSSPGFSPSGSYVFSVLGPYHIVHESQFFEDLPGLLGLADVTDIIIHHQGYLGHVFYLVSPGFHNVLVSGGCHCRADGQSSFFLVDFLVYDPGHSWRVGSSTTGGLGHEGRLGTGRVSGTLYPGNHGHSPAGTVGLGCGPLSGHGIGSPGLDACGLGR